MDKIITVLRIIFVFLLMTRVCLICCKSSRTKSLNSQIQMLHIKLMVGNVFDDGKKSIKTKSGGIKTRPVNHE